MIHRFFFFAVTNSSLTYGCSDHLLTDHGACVSDCSANKVAVAGKCVPCDGPCPKGRLRYSTS